MLLNCKSCFWSKILLSLAMLFALPSVKNIQEQPKITAKIELKDKKGIQQKQIFVAISYKFARLLNKVVTAKTTNLPLSDFSSKQNLIRAGP